MSKLPCITAVSAATAGLLTLSGCGTIYVGNVPFTAEQICSHELAGGTEVNVGCLPPTRAAHASGFHFVRFRQQLASADAALLRAARDCRKPGADTANCNGALPTNLLPSLIGRVFVPTEVEGKLRVPETGNMDYLALGPAGKPPADGIATDMLFVSDFTGAIEKKFQAEAKANAEAIAEAALKAVPAAAALSAPAQALLKDRIAGVALSTARRDTGRGHFIYVGMTAPHMDQLTTELSAGHWSLAQAPSHQTTTGAAPKALMGEVKMLTKSPKPKGDAQPDGSDAIEAPITTLLAAIKSSAAYVRVKKLGLITGAAILVTDGAESEVCSKQDMAFIQSGAQASVSTTCQALKAAMEAPAAPKAADGSAGTDAAPPAEASKEVSAALADKAVTTPLLLSVSVEYSRAARRTIGLERHASIYALQWVPIEVKP